MKWIEIEDKLRATGLALFTSQEFRRALGGGGAAAKMQLVRAVKKGLVQKLKDNRGLYALPKHPLHPWLVANRLLRPSYVSLETAMAHYGLLPESVYAVTSVTTRTTRSFQSLGRLFTYQKVKASAFGGYRPMDLDGQSVWVAEPEKAIADYLYFVHLGKKTLSERLRWSTLSRAKVRHYLGSFERPALLRWADRVIPR
jgi:predicted transcriptional regulator of viral defense system